MQFEEFRNTYVLGDGQVLNLAVHFDKPEIRARLNVQKRVGKSCQRHEIEICFEDAFEIDVLESFDCGWHTDVVFVRLNTGDYYISFDPYGNSGLPDEKDNFIIKCRRISVLDGGVTLKID